MLYNELEQEDILSGVRLRLATIAYGDILLRSIGLVYKIRQTPVNYLLDSLGGGDIGWYSLVRDLHLTCNMEDTMISAHTRKILALVFALALMAFTLPAHAA